MRILFYLKTLFKYAIAGVLFSNSGLADAAVNKCDAVYKEAMDHVGFSEKTKSLQHLERAQVECGMDAVYLGRLALLYLAVSRKSDAERVVGKGLSMYPFNRDLLFKKGLVDLAYGRAEAAKLVAEQIIVSNKSWAAGYYLLLRSLMDLGRFSESLEAGRRAVELTDGDLPGLYLSIAVANYHAGNLEECVKSAERAIYNDPGAILSPWGVDEAIYALNQLGRRSEALGLAKRRIAADPNWRSDPGLVKVLKGMGVVK